MNFMPLILLLVFFVLNIPIAFSLIMAVLYYFLFCNDTLAPYMIFQKMVSQGESFTLLAVPFFVAVGVIMNYSGIATRLMTWQICSQDAWSAALPSPMWYSAR